MSFLYHIKDPQIQLKFNKTKTNRQIYTHLEWFTSVVDKDVHSGRELDSFADLDRLGGERPGFDVLRVVRQPSLEEH
jgi:hypothetical protein